MTYMPRPDKLLAINQGRRGLYDPRITQDDISAALSFMQSSGKIGQGAYLLAMLLYRLDTDVIPSLVKIVRDLTREKIHDTTNERVINRIAKVVIVEVSHMTLCQHCNGHGVVPPDVANDQGNWEWLECPKCAGRCFVFFSKADRSRIAEVSAQTWDECYEKRYQMIYPVIELWRQAVLANLALQFRGK